MGKIMIGKMKNKHIGQVLEVEKLSFAIPWSRKSFEQELNDNPLARYFVASIDGRVVGYGGLWKVVDEGHITNIAIHPDYRKKGIGSRLLEEIINLACNEDITLLTLEVREGNLEAQALYEKFKFKTVGRRKDYYADNREDAIIMTLVFEQKE